MVVSPAVLAFVPTRTPSIHSAMPPVPMVAAAMCQTPLLSAVGEEMVK